MPLDGDEFAFALGAHIDPLLALKTPDVLAFIDKAFDDAPGSGVHVANSVLLNNHGNNSQKVKKKIPDFSGFLGGFEL